MPVSDTAETLIDMIGRGKIHISTAQQLAGSGATEAKKLGANLQALQAFGSLGGGHTGNVERDLHKWLHCLYGLQLQPYELKVRLKVFGHDWYCFTVCVFFVGAFVGSAV
jgi:hypothetical protein